MAVLRMFTAAICWLCFGGVATQAATVQTQSQGSVETSSNDRHLGVEIEGRWVQGGLLKGKTHPGNTLEFLKNKPRVAEDGSFILGLGRDVPKGVVLTVTSPEGLSASWTFNVEQREYNIQRVEGVQKKHVTPPESVSKRIKEEAGRVWLARQLNDERRDFEGGFVWPMSGPITGVYGSQRYYNGVPKRPHYGVDIAGPIGTPVSAPAPGVVTFADDDLYYSGGTLIVDHGHGLSSTFIHLSKVLVKKGDVIKQGQLIAEVGAGGRATGPHLDWRMNWFNQRIDPQLLVADVPMPGAEKK